MRAVTPPPEGATPGADGGRRRPRRLRAGDRVAVVAPAGPPDPELLAAGLNVLRSWDLEVEVGRHVSARHPRLGYLAGTDAERAADLEQAWCDPAIDAVFCARGGYGCLRILDLLDWDAMAAAAPKPLVGSSDVTAVHQVLGPALRVVTVFGPMVGTEPFVRDPVAQERLRTLLFEPASVTTLAGPRAEPLLEGRARGPLTGGTLSLVTSGQGTCDVMPPPPGAIGLLEDVNEDPYRLDHFLTHLRRTGWLARLGGLVLGSWSGCGDPAEVRSVLEDRLGDLGVPVVWELGFGHCGGQLSLPLGVEADLVSDRASGEARLVLPRAALD